MPNTTNADDAVAEKIAVAAERIAVEACAVIRKLSRNSHHDVSFYDTLEPNTGIFRSQGEAVSFLVDRALSTYSFNKEFKKELQGELGLGYLESYMRNWISGEMVRRTMSPLVREWLADVTQFASGEPFVK